MRARTGTFILSCCVKQCVLLLHNPNRGLAGLALGLGINFFSKSDSILVIDNKKNIATSYGNHFWDYLKILQVCSTYLVRHMQSLDW